MRTGKWWRTDAGKAGLIALVAAPIFVGAAALSTVVDFGAESAMERDCREAVRVRLNAPSTADFPDADGFWDDERYVVAGVVDAENGFGAKVRAAYTCEMSREDGSTTILDVRLAD